MFDSKPQTGSIYSRNKEDTLEAEALLWRALCDKPETLKKYMTDDCVYAAPNLKVYSPTSEPTLRKYIEEEWQPWTAYKMHEEPQFVEVDMMSSALTYRVTAWRQKGKEMVPTEALCSSVWRQDAGGDWRCCMHHMTKIGGKTK